MTALRAQTDGFESGVSGAVSSKKIMGKNFLPPKNLGMLCEQTAARRFASAVIHISSGDLAKACGRSKETAKIWKRGAQCPNGASLINLARKLPTVRKWLYEECEKAGEPVDNSKRAFDVAVAALMEDASRPGPAGDYARAILSRRVPA